MAISCQCPHCEHTYRLGDHLLGKAVRCKNCGESFKTLACEDGGPALTRSRPKTAAPAVRRGPPRDEEEVEEDRPVRRRRDAARARSGKGLLISGIVVAVAALLAVVIVVVVLNTDAPGDPGPKFPLPLPGGPVGGPDPGVLPWAVQVDPPRRPPQFPTGLQGQYKIPSGAAGSSFNMSPDVVFPSTPSVYVALGANKRPDDKRELLNLATGKVEATLEGDLGHDSSKAALREDGELLAVLRDGGNSVEVWSFRTRQKVQSFRPVPEELSKKVLGGLLFVGFAEPGKLVTARRTGERGLEEAIVERWDLASGQKDGEYRPTRAASFLSNWATISPGRKYLIFRTAEYTTGQAASFDFLDLGDMRLAGKLQVPTDLQKGVMFGTIGLAISPDGAQVAGLFSQMLLEKDARGFPKSRKVLTVQTWDVRTAAPQTRHLLGGQIPEVHPNNHSPGLQWLPDRSGWLVRGLALYDAANGQQLWTLPGGPFDSGVLRRLVGPHHVVQVFGTGPNQHIARILPLPRRGLP